MAFFDQAYKGNPPWDIGREQKAFHKLAKKYDLLSPLLDIGCGTGENSLYFAKLGFSILGIDNSPTAIAKANAKAEERNLQDNAKFITYDLFNLIKFGRTFNTVIDCGVFHMFSKEARILYEKNIRNILATNGMLFILAFSYKEPLGIGPNQRLLVEDYAEIFSSGWEIKSFQDEEFETNLRKNHAKALLTTIKRI